MARKMTLAAQVVALQGRVGALEDREKERAGAPNLALQAVTNLHQLTATRFEGIDRKLGVLGEKVEVLGEKVEALAAKQEEMGVTLDEVFAGVKELLKRFPRS